MTSDWHPELAGDDDAAPVRGPRRQRMLRVVVLVALAAMVLPLVLSAIGVARSAAVNACTAFVAAFDQSASGARVAFDLFGRGGPGWMCFAEYAGDERLVANLGLIPSGARLPAPGQDV
ncbi:hypothetical protein ACGGZK_09915 [Agromyces sp. MMS24-K17]|uniref:hypothetical protein n=1 Tax=Agromyces sp. MMS24-K17 TaxID=3372850 RepID=UPI0037540B1C